MIYFIQAGEDGPVKIGFAQTVEGVHRRMATFQTCHAESLRLIGFSEGTREDEATLHRGFAAERQRGEWFEPSDRLLEVAVSREMTRWFLDLQQCRERWMRWRLMDTDERLFHNGEVYLMELERRVLKDGWQLEDWYAENFGSKQAA